ncbi:hypothetical protein [Chitinophaga sp. Cy-1792]|uniref:hypothetical protein n=1 Tax=Chitinophaga sp. Cy-1792 TaxID=2608339 RepID=UPI0014213C74|nr:hypothetical protein [Chitinophaga sp. Cy-1792]NIG52810.1 hypothetical protein [Chitinophaga sp. Cy-1792]
MMRRHIFRRQVKNRGCYAEIVFDLEVAADDKIAIDIACHCPEWELMCKSAGAIFYDYFRRLKTGSVKIVVYEILWYPVDTNNLIVLFACLQAFAEAAGISLDNLTFDTDKELFCFPEIRSIG